MLDPRLVLPRPRYTVVIHHIYESGEFQAYTSQILALLMFALVLSEDRKSVDQRRRDIIAALNALPGEPLFR